MESNYKLYSDINKGDVYEFERKISHRDVMSFAKLSGDFNPLHMDRDVGKKSIFKNNIVHGMLAGSFFSTLIGMYCPGKNSLYISQTLNFRKVIYPNDTVIVRGTVINKSDSTRMIALKTEILKEDKIMVDGEAKVRVIK